MASYWTPEKEDQLRVFWNKGLSATGIARTMGGVSRNAVLGKARRMGLEARPSPILGFGTGQRPRSQRRIQRGEMSAKQQLRKDTLEEIVPPANREFAPFKWMGKVDSCQWPFGDPRKKGFHFCGDTEVLPGRAYCQKHCEEGTVPLPGRRGNPMGRVKV